MKSPLLSERATASASSSSHTSLLLHVVRFIHLLTTLLVLRNATSLLSLLSLLSSLPSPFSLVAKCKMQNAKCVFPSVRPNHNHAHAQTHTTQEVLEWLRHLPAPLLNMRLPAQAHAFALKPAHVLPPAAAAAGTTADEAGAKARAGFTDFSGSGSKSGGAGAGAGAGAEEAPAEAAWNIGLVLFTSEFEPSLLAMSLAQGYAGKIAVAEARGSNNVLAALFGLGAQPQYPQMVAVCAGNTADSAGAYLEPTSAAGKKLAGVEVRACVRVYIYLPIYLPISCASVQHMRMCMISEC